MRWSAPGAEKLLEAVTRRFEEAVWPEPPDGFARVGALRPMRQVLTGTTEGAGSSSRIFVKWSRPVTLTDRVRRGLAGGKGPREGKVLRALRARGVFVPRVLGFADEGSDLLVLEAVEDLSPLPSGSAASRADVDAVARLLGKAWGAGLRHRDLHRGNLGFVGDEPLLLDLGGARLRQGGSPVKELARLRHALTNDLSRAQRLRGLVAWLESAEGLSDPAAARARARSLANPVERAARRVTRTYRRGRDRRATRTGRHFEVFGRDAGLVGIRRKETPESWRTLAASWLGADPESAVPLKAGTRGRIVRFDVPGYDGSLVLKRYTAAAPGRVPRAIRAFRLSVALEHRGVATPRALLAVAHKRGGGILVTEYVAAPDLHRRWIDRDLRSGERRSLAVRLGRFLRAMHDAEVTHRDLKAPNLLVSDASPYVQIADVDGVRLRPAHWRRRARDLARLDASLDARATDRARAFLAYWRAAPPLRGYAGVDVRTFLREVARHVAAKRGPSGKPR